MKKISILFCALILSGCAMGINQSVATINDRPYLVEKKTYVLPIFMFYQWSTKPEITPLQITDENKKVTMEVLKNAQDKCSLESHKTYYEKCLKQEFKKYFDRKF